MKNKTHNYIIIFVSGFVLGILVVGLVTENPPYGVKYWNKRAYDDCIEFCNDERLSFPSIYIGKDVAECIERKCKKYIKRR